MSAASRRASASASSACFAGGSEGGDLGQEPGEPVGQLVALARQLGPGVGQLGVCAQQLVVLRGQAREPVADAGELVGMRDRLCAVEVGLLGFATDGRERVVGLLELSQQLALQGRRTILLGLEPALELVERVPP